MAKFRTRARTLDMLGRQQIAGIPTAISELFKNAHDAYADHVEIDYYRSDGLFLLRDDGVGMSQEDFTTRWLTLGTESKCDLKRKPPRDLSKTKRPMLGEKGIGRLAIATIGPQVLVLTRAKSENGASDLTVAFINWSIFELPGVDLDEIDIPIRTFSSGSIPSAQDVADMVHEFRVNAKNIGNRIEKNWLNKIEEELDRFIVDPQEIDLYNRKLSLKGKCHGTHFIIKPANQLLMDDIDGDNTKGKGSRVGKATPLKKALLGFSDTMNPASKNLIKTSFRDHKKEQLEVELIAEDDFFNHDEFLRADHRFSGDFDNYGQFRGDITIYGKTIEQHKINWPGNSEKATVCGGFSIYFAAIEGENKRSTIPPEEYAILSEKTEQLGGLYIYRNGIRVLPYGNTDFDWLDIELKRSKSAYYYYFSHRKMFGSVNIDSDRNSQLLEKAGREGFQQNKAYRQFRSILQNFFLQLAADFFRTEGPYADLFELRKTELSREDSARRQRKKNVSERKKKFSNDLNDFFEKIKNDEPRKEISAIIIRVKNDLNSLLLEAIDDSKSHRLLKLENQIRSELNDLEAKYRISRPQIGLSKASLRDWSTYNEQFALLRKNVFEPARSLIKKMIDNESDKINGTLNRRIRLESELNQFVKETRNSTIELRRKLIAITDLKAEETRDFAKQSKTTVELELREIINEFQQIKGSEISDDLFDKAKQALESRVHRVAEKQIALLKFALDQVQTVELSSNASVSEQMMALEQRNIHLEDEARANAQLVPLGMAVEILNHEFSGLIRAMRNGIRQLKVWADANKGLYRLYQDIRSSFEYLDGYLGLFAPLQRRLYRTKLEIHGHQIKTYLNDLFQARLKRHKVTLNATQRFVDAKITGYPSSFYPVFINLVDNSIFWLSQHNSQQQRNIILDEDNGCLLIKNNGPGIQVRDRNAIFELGFSRKPGGSGIGLYVSRESLRKIGYELQLLENHDGVTFGLVPSTESQKEKVQ